MTPEVKTWRTIVNIKSIINENEKFYNPFASGLCLHKESSQIVLGNDLIKIGKKSLCGLSDGLSLPCAEKYDSLVCIDRAQIANYNKWWSCSRSGFCHAVLMPKLIRHAPKSVICPLLPNQPLECRSHTSMIFKDHWNKNSDKEQLKYVHHGNRACCRTRPSALSVAAQQSFHIMLQPNRNSVYIWCLFIHAFN